MQVDWVFGPDRERFALDAAGRLRSPVGTPFHGIVSLGMRDILVRNRLPVDVWLRKAHLIFEQEAEPDDELAALRECSAEAAALSFGESCVAVRAYLGERFEQAEAWNIKEGHTSSVWKVTVEDGKEFVLNVGRDSSASAALAATSEQMREIKRRRSDINMAAVLDIRTVCLRRGAGSVDVVVTQNEWIADSTEIHVPAAPDEPSRRYLLVERFLTSAAAPAQIASIYGRWCTDDECVRIDRDLAWFREVARGPRSDAPIVNLAHGDVVWNGRGAVVVAIS